jgi:hypothetical protein
MLVKFTTTLVKVVLKNPKLLAGKLGVFSARNKGKLLFLVLFITANL